MFLALWWTVYVYQLWDIIITLIFFRLWLYLISWFDEMLEYKGNKLSILKMCQEGFLSLWCFLMASYHVIYNCTDTQPEYFFLFLAAWGNLGNVLKSQSKIPEAESAYRNALYYRSNMADMLYNLWVCTLSLLGSSLEPTGRGTIDLTAASGDDDSYFSEIVINHASEISRWMVFVISLLWATSSIFMCIDVACLTFLEVLCHITKIGLNAFRGFFFFQFVPLILRWAHPINLLCLILYIIDILIISNNTLSLIKNWLCWSICGMCIKPGELVNKIMALFLCPLSKGTNN